MMFSTRLGVIAIGGVLLLVSGCSELKEDLPPPVAPGVTVHPPGWSDPASASFHGEAIQAGGWDLRPCQVCHGSDYTGGISHESCRTCHSEPTGPEYCTTCHGGASNAAPPEDLDGNTGREFRGVGAHQLHLNPTARVDAFACSECHVVPGSVHVPGHVDSPRPAEVPMPGLARTVTNEPGTADHDAALPVTTPVPQYDAAGTSCANTYCHGNFKNGNPSVVVWNSLSSIACGTCHGDPTRPNAAQRPLPRTSAEGGTHPSSSSPCSSCHGTVVDANLRIINTALHVNGRLNVFGTERDF